MQLSDHGIFLRTSEAGDYKTTCPQCSSHRRNKSDRCLSVTLDGDGGAVWKCHHCEWVGNIPSKNNNYMPKRREYVKPSVPNNLQPSIKMMEFFSKRKISEKTVNDFGIYFDSAKSSISFPYELDGEIVNIKFRTFDKQFSQSPKARRSLYNIDSVKEMWSEDVPKEVIFVEGEMDVLALAESGFKNVVTLPDGAPQQTKFDANDKRFTALSESEWLNNADKVIIAVDNDSAGENLAKELTHRFGKHRCFQVSFPDLNDFKCKDSNETLVYHGADVLRECIELAKPYPEDGLYRVVDYEKAVFDIYQGNYQKPVSTGFKTLDEYYQVMAGTFQVITGIPNHGKSNFLDQLILNVAKIHDWRFAIFSPEHSASLHIRRLVEKVVQKPFEIGFTERMSVSELSEGINFLNDRFHFIESKDEIPDIDWILEKARAASIRFGIKGLVIDPFNKISAKRGGNVREDEHIRDLIAKCQKFCQSHNVTIWMVAHPHKLQRSEGGAYAPPSLYEIAGSAHWNNMADVGLVVHRDFDNDTTRLIVRKIREQGLYGNIGEVNFTFSKTKRIYQEMIG
jgi:twinkle protein